MAFIALQVALEFVRSLREPLARVAEHDGNLAGQVRRAAVSVPSNLAEGRRRSGADRLYHWKVAAGSTDEVVAELLTAEALGYVDAAKLRASLGLADEILAMCWRMTHPSRAA